MAVFRIEKTRDYTVMSNYHLRDMSLSLKAKGLLSLMLSLPENWDYTMKGLARICKDGIDSISGGIRELEAHGYLVRVRVRGANGQLGSIEYTILEQPKTPSPTQEKPIRENLVRANPMLDAPIQENPAQLNKEESSNYPSKTDLSITQESSPILSSPPVPRERSGQDGMRKRESYRALILENIEYDVLSQNVQLDKDRLDELVELMVDTVCSNREMIRVAGDDYVYSGYMTLSDTGGEADDGLSLSIDPDKLSELFEQLMGGSGGVALTPDGNLSLIDDIGSSTRSGKQFITVETKNGNVFYIIIDRDDEGEETVHFLNQVDEADLLTLMGDDAPAAETPAVCNCKEKCAAGAVNTNCPVCKNNLSECSGKEPVTEPEPEPEQPEKKSSGGLLVIVLLVVLAGGGAFAYMKFIKPKQGVKVSADPDDYDFEDEEYLAEENTQETNIEETF